MGPHSCYDIQWEKFLLATGGENSHPRGRLFAQKVKNRKKDWVPRRRKEQKKIGIYQLLGRTKNSTLITKRVAAVQKTRAAATAEQRKEASSAWVDCTTCSVVSWYAFRRSSFPYKR